MDYGFTEEQFWTMTIAELERSIDSKKRVKQDEAREKAMFDYLLANLIGKSVARIYSSSNDYPGIEEAYPMFFDSEEIQEQKAQKQDELSALRFKQFATSFNSKFNKEEAKDN